MGNASGRSSVYDCTDPSLKGLVGGTVRFFAGERPRTDAGKVAMHTISNATFGLIPNSNLRK